MKKRLKIFLTVIVSIFSFIFIGNVKAASSDFSLASHCGIWDNEG